MTNEAIFKKEIGEAAFRELSARLKKIIRRIDSINADKPPVTSKQLEAALK